MSQKYGPLVVSAQEIAPGTVTGAKISPTGVRTGSFAGRNGAGACTLTNAAVGMRVFALFRIDDASNAVGQEANFESTITVADQIQQSSASNLSAQKFVAFLIPASA